MIGALRWWASCIVLLSCTGPARADSDEAWLQRAAVPANVRPLLVLLLDMSAAMAEPVEALPPYDPSRDYSLTRQGNACARDRVYWQRGPGPAPSCRSAQWVSLASTASDRGWRCQAGQTALDRTGVYVAVRAAQWEPRSTGGYWRELRAGDAGAVECRADRGLHGTAAGNWFAADGPTGPWDPDPQRETQWNAPPLADAYVFYSGNFLNYLASGERQASTRYDWLVRRIGAAARSVDGLDIAIARTSHDGLGGDDEGRGGMIVLAPRSLPAAADTLDTMLGAWAPAGPAPLAESLGEVTRWLGGRPVRDGLHSHAAPATPLPSAEEARMPGDAGRYRSPLTHACRAVLLGVLTAGLPSADEGAAAAVAELTAADAAPGDCAGNCLARLARALAGADLSSLQPGLQRIQTRFAAPPSSSSIVREAARAAGHRAVDLDDPLTVIALAAEAVQNDAGIGAEQRISAVGLEVMAFAAADLAVYYGMSAPSPQPPWAGNLRRYRLAAAASPTAPAAVVGRDDAPVFDAPSGRLRTDSWSVWADRPDGADVAAGGAASRLPEALSRKIYTDLTAAPLTDAANRLSPDNGGLTRELVGLDDNDPRTVAEVVAWALGQDVFDDDFDDDSREMRLSLGDPGLRAPQVLRYAPDGDGLAFVATEDGLLHAFDADTGIERWAFLPGTLLPRLAGLTRPFRSVARAHGLDGVLTLQVNDVDRDGRIVAAQGDGARLVFGLGRGGTGYYALDISDPHAPVLMWSLSAADLPGFGQSWPAPVPARMRLGAAGTGSETRVVLLAGGFDPAEDSPAGRSTSLGAGMALVAADSGRILWRVGGSSDLAADLQVAAMTRSVPAAPRVLDTDGDGLADRAYLLDIGGRLWRFDFPASGDPAGIVVTLIATLGGDADPSRSRRFFATPDVVYEQRDDVAQLALAFGSGWLSRPRALAPEDRFFVVFDGLADAAQATPLDERDLADVTDPPHAAPPDARGWMLRLTQGSGEKTVGPSLTFDHRLRFLTYQPLPPAAIAPCGPPASISRQYTLDVRSGQPVNRVGDQPVPAEELTVAGLPPGLRVAFPAVPRPDACPGACPPAAFGLLGGQSVSLDFANDPVRTSWRQLDATAE